MASLKNIVILGLVMISMIAAESMLRTDDYDLAYLSDSEEVKADPQRRDLPTTSECGTEASTVPGTEANCQGDTTKRCCLASYTTGTDTKVQVNWCVAAVNADYVSSTASSAVADLKNLFKEDASLTFKCAEHTTIPVLAPATDKQCLIASTPPKNKDTTTAADCDYSDNASRCCFVKLTSGGDQKGSYCIKSGVSSRSTAAAAYTANDFKFTTTGASCGADAPVVTQSDCGSKTPSTPTDCHRDLSSKCCQVTFGTGSAICLKAGSVARAQGDGVGQSAILNLYGDNVTAEKVLCQKSGTVLANNCGVDKDKKALGADVTPFSKGNCTADADSICCLATSFDKTKTRCVKSNIAKKDSKNITSDAVNATLWVEDNYNDLSLVECSSVFVKASVAIVAIVLALF